MDNYCGTGTREVQANDLKMQVDWNREFPDSVSIPVVTIHSMIFDFGQVSFLDVVAVDCIKGVSKSKCHVYINYAKEVYINVIFV